MIHHIDAIFSQRAFRLLEPLAMPEGSRVHLSIEEETDAKPVQSVAKIHTPKLAHPEDAADFVMESSGDGQRRGMMRSDSVRPRRNASGGC